jgi:hypothetical protein
MLIRSTDKRKDKQQTVIGFIHKLIPPRDIANERVCSKFKHLRWVVAQDIVMKICKTLYRQTYRKTESWHRIHTKRNTTIWHPILVKTCNLPLDIFKWYLTHLWRNVNFYTTFCVSILYYPTKGKFDFLRIQWIMAISIWKGKLCSFFTVKKFVLLFVIWIYWTFLSIGKYSMNVRRGVLRSKWYVIDLLQH